MYLLLLMVRALDFTFTSAQWDNAAKVKWFWHRQINKYPSFCVYEIQSASKKIEWNTELPGRIGMLGNGPCHLGILWFNSIKTKLDLVDVLFRSSFPRVRGEIKDNASPRTAIQIMSFEQECELIWKRPIWGVIHLNKTNKLSSEST